MLKSILALASCVTLALPAAASIGCNATCDALLKQGYVLQSQGRNRDAMGKFQEASRADPAASLPVSQMAAMFLGIAQGERKDAMRQEATRLARLALQLGPGDPVAQEVLRKLDEDAPQAIHEASGVALAAMQEAEGFFHAEKFAEAVQSYERAAQLDPALSQAWLYAGDSFFMQKNYAEAETRFRKAVGVEPLNGQAWRFLADALIFQGKRDDAQAALLKGIEAQPSQLPNWDKLEKMRAADGTPLQALNLKPMARLLIGQGSNKNTVELDPPPQGSPLKSAEQAVWMSRAMEEAALLTRKNGRSPYAIALASWRKALQVAAELSAQPGMALSDSGLLALVALDKDDQLETALLLLMYREAYRPELETWKAAHPKGVKKFIDAYGLRP
ncbi:tetratricopeptide repeat protein [Oxalobacteraceae bacterium]|nr:tetratricopeptide repeat protein [Oxalobacteraceae bacterium]